MVSKLKYLKDVDQFCCSDYSSMFFNCGFLEFTQANHIIQSEISLLKPNLITFFNKKNRTYDEIMAFQGPLKKAYISIQDQLPQIDKDKFHVLAIKKPEITEQEIDRLYNNTKKILQQRHTGAGQSALSTYNYLSTVYSFSEGNFYKVYEILKKHTEEHPKTELLDEEKILQDQFQEMLLAFQLVYHQVKFSIIYVEVPLIYRALLEEIEKFKKIFSQHHNLEFFIHLLENALSDFEKFANSSDEFERDEKIKLRDILGAKAEFTEIAVLINQLEKNI